MYEMNDDTDGFLGDDPAHGAYESPAPLESWSLSDFSDLILSNGAEATVADAWSPF